MGHAHIASQDTDWTAQTTSVLHVEQDIILMERQHVKNVQTCSIKIKKDKYHANHAIHSVDHVTRRQGNVRVVLLDMDIPKVIIVAHHVERRHIHLETQHVNNVNVQWIVTVEQEDVLIVQMERN